MAETVWKCPHCGGKFVHIPPTNASQNPEGSIGVIPKMPKTAADDED